MAQEQVALICNPRSKMMASVAARAFAFLALLLVCLEMTASPVCVQAADEPDAPAADAAAAEVQVTESAEGGEVAEGTEAAEATEGATEEEKAQKGEEFADSARELQEKLGQLRALLDAKGEGADPALKERLAGLETQLKGLGLDGLGGAAGSNPELTEFLGACVAMSMRRAGMQRPATLGALRKLVEKRLPPAEAAKNELWRMVAVCVTDFKEDEFASFKSGKVKILPKVYVDDSKKPEAEKKVLEIDDQVWEELRKISEGLLKDLVGDPEMAEKPPFNVAYLAMIPFLGFCGVMVYGFMKVNQANEEKASKKSKKAEKKGN